MSNGLEGLTSTSAVYQSERTILTDWRAIADELAEALKAVVRIQSLARQSVGGGMDEGPASVIRGALDHYEAAVAHLKPEPLPMGPATHEITYWAWSGDKKTETATSEPRGFTRPGKVRQKQGNRYAMVDAPLQWFEWRRPEGGVNEVRADRLLVVKPVDSKPRVTDAERVPDDQIFEGLTGEHISVPEGRPWDRTSTYLAKRAGLLNGKTDPPAIPEGDRTLAERSPLLSSSMKDRAGRKGDD